MTDARDVALDVLNRVDQGSAFASAVLATKRSRLPDPRDAAFAAELVLGVLRRRSFLDHLLIAQSTRGLSKIDPQTRQILRLGAYQIAFLPRVPARAAVSRAVEQEKQRGSGGLQGLVNALLRGLSRLDPSALTPNEADDGQSVASAAVQLSLPQWLFSRLVSTYGRNAAFEMARAFNRPARRTLRVNIHRISRSDVLTQPNNGNASPGSLTPFSVDVTDKDRAAALVEAGNAAYQDEGAQLAAMALCPTPQSRILDACAGRGGKTAALAMMTGGSVQITAADRSQSKLERLSFELSRQGLNAVTTIAADILTDADKVGSTYDRVLLDAPCSGSGTMGRRPEIRWRLTPDLVHRLCAVQRDMLAVVANRVAPGGVLVYAVCSLLHEEGMHHVDAFLETHPGFHLNPTPPSDWPDAVPWSGGRIVVMPSIAHTDGYQILSFLRD
ncbi:MAG: 16S rRNA (cytosine(967)-C(5))-methyltransferase RsmB [Myxococcota bacterium]|nr:16S rRNA (cytosine(967)-C(5))-methyltransferase RsmB [Myxococcota bacterium]